MESSEGRDAAEDAGDGTRALPIDECERRLVEGGVGILALSGIESPVLRPVNFVYRDGVLILRTGEGQILSAAQDAEPASFVICEIDRFEHTGWSVVVSGRLEERSPFGRLSELPLRPWARGERHHLVGLSTETISGRQIGEMGWAP